MKGVKGRPSLSRQQAVTAGNRVVAGECPKVVAYEHGVHVQTLRVAINKAGFKLRWRYEPD
jgi:hypothetical protein